MSTSGIQGQVLELTVVGARNLRDKEWISRQDPYVIVEYGQNRFRTKTDTDGGKNPSFNDKFTLPLIEGLREVQVQVWNSNMTFDDFIGSGKILLERALSTGYDDSGWSLLSKTGKHAGELMTILHFSNAGKGGQKVKSDAAHAPAAPYPYGHPPAPYPAYAPPQAPYAGYAPPPYAAPSGYPAPSPYGPPPVPYAAAPPPHIHPPGHGPSAYPSGYPQAPGSGAPYYGAPPPSGGYPPAYPGYPPQW